MSPKCPNHEQVIPQKSHCQPPSPEELELLRQKYGIRKRRFSRAARLTQIMYTLTACGPRNMRSLAQIIAGYTGEDPEVVRRILYRHLKLLTDLWFVEKKGKEFRITPIGLYVMANLDKDELDTWLMPYIPFWIASRLEEWEKALRGLRVFLENFDAIWYLEIEDYYPFDEILAMVERGEFPRVRSNRPPNLTEREVLYQLLIFGETKRFDEDDPVLILHNLSEIFAPYFVGTYLYELHKDLPEEFEKALMRHDARLRKVASLLRLCSYEECPEESLSILLENLFERSGLLYYLNELDPELLEKMTGWPQGKPPIPSALALIAAQELLPDEEIEYMIIALKKSEEKMSELLATLIVVHVMDNLRSKLDELAHDIHALSKAKNTIMPRLWALRSAKYRDLLGAVLLLNRIINEDLDIHKNNK